LIVLFAKTHAWSDLEKLTLNTSKSNLGGVIDLLIKSGFSDQAAVYLERYAEGQEEAVAGYVEAFKSRLEELSIRR